MRFKKHGAVTRQQTPDNASFTMRYAQETDPFPEMPPHPEDPEVKHRIYEHRRQQWYADQRAAMTDGKSKRWTIGTNYTFAAAKILNIESSICARDVTYISAASKTLNGTTNTCARCACVVISDGKTRNGVRSATHVYVNAVEHGSDEACPARTKGNADLHGR